jgi:hypothetical protein
MKGIPYAVIIVLSLPLLVIAFPAAAEETEAPSVSGGAVRQSAGSANLLSLTHGAALQGKAQAFGLGGYDTARKAGVFEANAEVRIWGPISVRGGAVHTTGSDTLRPTFGARFQALRESVHGFDGSVGVFYRPEGLTEPEGEIEAVFAAGMHLGRTYAVANVLYGQDPEAQERDGEVRLAALHPVGERLFLGVDSRLRFDLGSDSAKLAAHGEPTLDVLGGPAATLLLGPVALLAQGGASAIRLQGATRVGGFVLGGLGAAF